MSVCWLIERGFDDENAVRLAEAAEQLGDEVRHIRYVPFGRYFETEGNRDWSPGRQVYFGSINGLKALWTYSGSFGGSAAWCDFEKLRCSSYYNWYGEHLLGHRYVMLPIREVLRRQRWLFQVLGVPALVRSADLSDSELRLFIRPDANDKWFNGEVVAKSQFENWAASIFGSVGRESEGLCVVSTVEPVDAEYRLVVARGKVVAASRYRLSGKLDIQEGCPPGTKQFIETLAREWEPDELWVADVAQQREPNIRANPPEDFRPDRFRLIEIGSVNVAGLYACDLDAVVSAVHEVASGIPRT